MVDPEYVRMMSQLRLALLNDCGCEDTLAKVENEARDAGLSGADIDAALAERSFDIRTSAILALGCAIKNADLPAYTAARKRVLDCGLTHEALDYFEAAIDQLLKEMPN